MKLNHIKMRRYEFHLTIPGEIPIKKYCLFSSDVCSLPKITQWAFSFSLTRADDPDEPPIPFASLFPLFFFFFVLLSFFFLVLKVSSKNLSHFLPKPLACVFICQLAVVSPKESSSLWIICLLYQKKNPFEFQKNNLCISQRSPTFFKTLFTHILTLWWSSIMPKKDFFLLRVLQESTLLIHW